MRIVRVFWGDSLPHVRWDRLWQDVAGQVENGAQCDQSVYVYGKSNADRLTRLCGPRYKIELVGDDPYPLGLHDESINGSLRDIKRPWRYKHELLLHAVHDNGPVIYCDWDVQCLVKDISAAFAKLEDRRFALISVSLHARGTITSRTARDTLGRLLRMEHGSTRGIHG